MKLEKLGLSLSLICAIHCVSLPLLLTLAPLVGQSFWADPVVENTLLVSSVFIAAYTLGKDYISIHKRASALFTAAFGFGIILITKTLLPANYEPVMMAIGGGVTAWAYYLNWKLRRLTVCTKGCQVSHKSTTMMRAMQEA